MAGPISAYRDIFLGFVPRMLFKLIPVNIFYGIVSKLISRIEYYQIEVFTKTETI